MTPAVKRPASALAELGIPLSLAPMEAQLVAELPTEPGWQFEPKWDGFRCLAFRAGGEVEIKAKSGKSLARFFPEVLSNLRALPTQHFVLDGELVIPVEGNLSFDALQMRLHPAESRIRRLARETPAVFVAFDCLLRKPRQPLLERPFEERRASSKRFLRASMRASRSRLSPAICARPRPGSTGANWRSTASSPSGSIFPTNPASAPCSKSNACARPIVSSAAFAMAAANASSDRCCSASTMMTACCTTSASRQPFPPGQAGADGAAGKTRRAAGLHRQCAGRPKPLEHRADRPNGSPCDPSSSSRFDTIM